MQIKHLSAAQLQELFQSMLGQNQQESYANDRIEECKVLLRDGQLTTGQIAQKSGFSTCSISPGNLKASAGSPPANISPLLDKSPRGSSAELPRGIFSNYTYFW